MQVLMAKEGDLTEVVDWCLETVKDPNRLLELSRILRQKEQNMKVQQVGYRVQSIITEIEQQERTRLERKDRLAKLQAEQEKEYVRWRVLPSDLASELRELQLQDKLDVYRPQYYLLNSKQRGDCLLEVSKLMVHSILDHLQAKKIDRKTMTQRLDIILDEVQDPSHLSELAKLLLTRHETEYVLRFGEKCQGPYRLSALLISPIHDFAKLLNSPHRTSQGD